MKCNLYPLKRLFIIYFFGFLPLGLITQMLSFFGIINLELNILPVSGFNNFISIIFYTIIFSLVSACINGVLNSIIIRYDNKYQTAEFKMEEIQFTAQVFDIRKNIDENISQHEAEFPTNLAV